MYISQLCWPPCFTIQSSVSISHYLTPPDLPSSHHGKTRKKCNLFGQILLFVLIFYPPPAPFPQDCAYHLSCYSIQNLVVAAIFNLKAWSIRQSGRRKISICFAWVIHSVFGWFEPGAILQTPLMDKHRCGLEIIEAIWLIGSKTKMIAADVLKPWP